MTGATAEARMANAMNRLRRFITDTPVAGLEDVDFETRKSHSSTISLSPESCASR